MDGASIPTAPVMPPPPAPPPAPPHAPHAEILGTETVLKAEFALVWPEAPPPDTIDAYRAAVLDRGQAALCLSGGGIRSAAFSLGVIQALAAKGLLTRFHYLSTVSGGGYIGGWLSRWIDDVGGEADIVQQRLKESVVGCSGDPPQIKHLRQNSNFITPKIGAASMDTWTAIALSVRNIVTNWLIFGPALLLTVLLFNLYETLFEVIRDPMQASYLLVFGALLLLLATFHGCRDLPSHATVRRDGRYLFRWVALPSIGWALIVPLTISSAVIRPGVPAPYGGAIALAAFVALWLGYLGATLWRGIRQRRAYWMNSLVWLVATATSAGGLYLGAKLLEHVPAYAVHDDPLTGFAVRESARSWQTVVLGTFGPLWVILAQLLTSIVFAAFRVIPQADATAPGRLLPDLDREWLARLSALKIRPALLWTALACVCLLVPLLLDQITPVRQVGEWISGAIVTLSGMIAVLGGRSTGTSSGHETRTAAPKPLPFRVIVSAATMVFAIFLFSFLAIVELKIAEAIAHGALHVPRGGRLSPGWLFWGHIGAALLLGPVLALTSTRINVNRFSLNGLYRNRLQRAFLGGARGTRDPDPFTGFDEGDNLPLVELAATSGGKRVLLPVINVALNIVDGDRLDWQERKAEPFVLTPVACGSATLDPGARHLADAPPAGAYIPTSHYGGKERGAVGEADQGITLATALSISGAAASPSMGYHSSPATAFLMTLFNVRLGAWLPNPARADSLGKRLRRSGPTNALWPLLSELAGLTNDKGDNVYLSDGGHFENLGLYEMIRRRCRYIVVVDAGCDPGCSFEDLGNAVRKIAIDQDRVDISFQTIDIRSRGSPATPSFAYALGSIRYPERPDAPGQLLYIKPSYFDPMPMDVRAYAEVHASFPHETTADQWFSESQFESYRKLGEYLTAQLGGEVPADLAAFFAVVAQSDRVA